MYYFLMNQTFNYASVPSSQFDLLRKCLKREYSVHRLLLLVIKGLFYEGYLVQCCKVCYAMYREWTRSELGVVIFPRTRFAIRVPSFVITRVPGLLASYLKKYYL